MKKLYTLAIIAALALAAAYAHGPRAAAAPEMSIGTTVADFKLSDVDGRERTLASLKGKAATVLIFVSTQCPVSNAYNQRMEKLAQDYRGRGVSVVGINSNVAETPDDIRQHALEQGFSFAVLKDKGNAIADRLGARVTPEAFLLDGSNRLVYRGRIDNSRNGDSITANDLRDALDATLAGKPVAKAEVNAFGCSIKRAAE